MSWRGTSVVFFGCIGCVLSRKAQHFKAVLLSAVSLFSATATEIRAQTPDAEPPVISRGSAVVTGFSGVALRVPKPGTPADPNADPQDSLIIDAQQATLQVFDLLQMFGPDDARLTKVPRLLAASGEQIGQVFGVALDDGLPASGAAPGGEPVPNIYATATSAYGLYIDVEREVGAERTKQRLKSGAPGATWMHGLFGTAHGGGPGSIWKFDGRTGKVSLFANVTLNGVANSGPALGSIAFDPVSRRLFVSDLQTGMIHAFDLTGREVGRFDHGMQGRPKLGLTAVPFDESKRVAITNPAFNVQDTATWGFAERDRRVWGLAVHDRRLFYATVSGPDIWSVGLTPTGDFADNAQVEIEVQTAAGDPISAITFGRDGAMYLSQRGALVAGYDFRVLTKASTAQLLRYKRKAAPNGNLTWEPVPEEYAVGHGDKNRSTNGGVALGYGYDDSGVVNPNVCEGTVWTTGEILRLSTPPDPRLQAGGEIAVHGLQGTAVGNVKPANKPPMKSYFIDFDDEFDDAAYRGHMGQIAIWACDRTLAVAGGQSPPGLGVPPRGPAFNTPGGPRRPGGPPQPRYADLEISKEGSSECEAGSACGFLIKIKNKGTRTFDGPVFLSDAIGIPGLANVNVNFLATTLPGCQPNQLPFVCNPHLTLGAGATRTFHVIVDIPRNAVAPGTAVQARNCAFVMNPKGVDQREFLQANVQKLDPRNPAAGPGFSCMNFRINRAAPNPAACLPLPVVEATMTPERMTFAGPGEKVNVKVEIRNTGNNRNVAIRNWRSPTFTPALDGVTCWDPPGGTLRPNISQFCEGTYTTTAADVARRSAPLNVTVRGECRGTPIKPVDANSVLNYVPANLAQPPGKQNPPVPAPGPRPNPNACVPVPVMEVTMTPARPTFTGAGEAVNVRVEIRNTGNNNFDGISNWRTPTFTPALTGVTCWDPPGGTLRPGVSQFCEGTYTTTAADVAGRSAPLNVTVRGECKGSPIRPVNAGSTLTLVPPNRPVAPVPPVPNPACTLPSPIIAVTPGRTTYAGAGESIRVEVTLTNPGPADLLNWHPPKSDQLPNLRCLHVPGESLKPGNPITCFDDYKTTAADAAEIVATLRGEACSRPVPPVVGRAKLTRVVAVLPPGFQLQNERPIMKIAQVCTPPQFTVVGTEVTCTVTVTNTGKVPAPGCLIRSPYFQERCPGPVAGNGGTQTVTVKFRTPAPQDIPVPIQLLP